MVKGQGSPLISSYVLSSDDDSPARYPLIGLYDRPLPFCGCGIGWFSCLFGLVIPLAWYYGAFLYLTNYYEYEPRERSGLAVCAIMALICTIVLLIVLLVYAI